MTEQQSWENPPPASNGPVRRKHIIIGGIVAVFVLGAIGSTGREASRAERPAPTANRAVTDYSVYERWQRNVASAIATEDCNAVERLINNAMKEGVSDDPRYETLMQYLVGAGVNCVLSGMQTTIEQ